MRKDLGSVEKRIDKHIGAKLALLRHERNLSQEELCGILEPSQATIRNYEKGNDRISASRLVSIARALESNIAYFSEGAPEWEDGSSYPIGGYRLWCGGRAVNAARLRLRLRDRVGWFEPPVLCR